MSVEVPHGTLRLPSVTLAVLAAAACGGDVASRGEEHGLEQGTEPMEWRSGGSVLVVQDGSGGTGSTDGEPTNRSSSRDPSDPARTDAGGDGDDAGAAAEKDAAAAARRARELAEHRAALAAARNRLDAARDSVDWAEREVLATRARIDELLDRKRHAEEAGILVRDVEVLTLHLEGGPSDLTLSAEIVNRTDRTIDRLGLAGDLVDPAGRRAGWYATVGQSTTLGAGDSAFVSGRPNLQGFVVRPTESQVNGSVRWIECNGLRYDPSDFGSSHAAQLARDEARLAHAETTLREREAARTAASETVESLASTLAAAEAAGEGPGDRAATAAPGR